MNRSVIMILGGVFALLMIGLAFSQGVGLPVKEQVSNPEASALATTDEKIQLLVALIVVVVSSILVMGAGLYAVLFLANRQIATVQQQPAQEFNLLSSGMNPQTAGNFVMDNALFIMIGVGGVMVVVTLAVIALS